MATPGIGFSPIQIALQAFQTAQAVKIQAGTVTAPDVPQAEFQQHMDQMHANYRIPEQATAIILRPYILPTYFQHAPIELHPLAVGQPPPPGVGIRPPGAPLHPPPPPPPAPVAFHSPILSVYRIIPVTLDGNAAYVGMIQETHNALVSIYNAHSQAIQTAANSMGQSGNSAVFLAQLNTYRQKAITDANNQIDVMYNKGIALGNGHHEQAARVLVSHNEIYSVMNTLVNGWFGVHNEITSVVHSVAHATVQTAQVVVQKVEGWASGAVNAVGNAVSKVLSIF